MESSIINDNSKKLNSIARTLLAILLIYASVEKLRDVNLFTLQMYKSPLLPEKLVPFLAIFIPAVEILLACMLYLPKIKFIGFYGSFFLMLCFSLYLIALTRLFSNIPCACGGILGGMSYPVHIAFNIAFTLIALVGIYTSDHDSKPDTLLNQQAT